jgi:hypothetical protein
LGCQGKERLALGSRRRHCTSKCSKNEDTRKDAFVSKPARTGGQTKFAWPPAVMANPYCSVTLVLELVTSPLGEVTVTPKVPPSVVSTH